MKISDSKQLEQFLKSIKARTGMDDFGKDVLRVQIEQYEQMQHFEKGIDRILSQKRIEIQENLAYSSQSIETTLRLFIDSKVTDSEAGERIFALNIFGRLILKEEERMQGEFFQNYRVANSFEKNLLKQFYFPDFVKELTVEFPETSLTPVKYSPSVEKVRKSNLKNQEKTGFSIVRTFPGNCSEKDLKCRVTLMLEGMALELKSPLKEFLGRQTATRREVLDRLWEYISSHRLLEKDTVILDSVLRQALDFKSQDGNILSLDEISLRTHSLMAESPKFYFNYTIQNEEGKSLRVWDLAISAPLEEISDCMAFFVQKLIFTDEEKERFLKDEHYNDFNAIIKSNERTNQVHEAIIKRFQRLERHLAKRDAFAKLRANPRNFFESFITRQRQSLETIKSYSSGILSKRNFNDENEFVELLAQEAGEVLEGEVSQYLRTRILANKGSQLHR